MRTLSLLLPVALVALALTGFAALAGGHWLGLIAGPGIRVTITQPVLFVEADGPVTEAALRDTLREAGMAADGALLRRTGQWPVTDPFAAPPSTEARLAIEVPAEAARSLGRLPPDFRLDRTAGGAGLYAALPDRGPLTRTIAWPVLRWQLDRLVTAGSHVPERVMLREDGAELSVQVSLRDLHRGEAATAVEVPALQAPRLP